MLGPTPRPGRRKRKRQSKSVAAPRVSAIKEREEKPPTPAEDGDWDLLPQCPGPKLGPFLPKPTNIQYVEYISDPEESGDSCVFEVLIHGKRYALKVFKFQEKEFYDYDNWLHTGPGYHPERIPADETLPMAHLDPFFSECRAYGAIIDHGLNGIITPPCYGYLMLSEADEEYILDEYGLNADDWNRDLLEPADAGLPLRALVKELMPDGPQFTPDQVHAMLKDLKTLHRIGIFLGDELADRNYRFGKLFDFSRAMVKPHVKLSYGLLEREHIGHL